MSNIKRCSQCNTKKNIEEFYLCVGKPRSECKKCTIKRNVKYQRQTEAWKYRYADDESRKSYMREYYSKNKEKFTVYRAKFKSKFPEYYKNYYRRKKEK